MSQIYDIKNLIRFIADNREKFVGVPYITATIKLDANKIEPYEYNGCLIEPISPESMPIEQLNKYNYSNNKFVIYSVEDIHSDEFDSFSCSFKLPKPLLNLMKNNSNDCVTILHASWSSGKDAYNNNEFSFISSSENNRYKHKGILKIPFLLLHGLMFPIAQGIGGGEYSEQAAKNTIVVFETFDGARIITSFEFNEETHEFIFYSNQFNSFNNIKISGDRIDDNMFEKFDSIESVFIEDGVNYIGKTAFSCCSQLTQIKLPNSIEVIGENCFSFTGIKNIKLPEKIKQLGDRTFYYNSKLSSIDIPDSVEVIGEECFSDCSNLSNVKLPEQLVEIKAKAFYACWNITKIVFPQKLKKINRYSFSCTKITDIILPRGIEEIGEYAFSSTYDKITKTLALPDSIKSLNKNAFDNIHKNTTIVYVESENNEVVMKFINDNQLKHEVNPSIFDNHIVQESSYSIKQINEAIRYWSRQLKILNNLKK